jgi:hypothetical protein
MQSIQKFYEKERRGRAGSDKGAVNYVIVAVKRSAKELKEKHFQFTSESPHVK